MTDFDRTWAGPPHVKPNVYRSQSEKDTWHAVVVDNEYRLGPTLAPDDVVIDIGAHIGSFSYLAYLAGSRSIYAFEIEQDHYDTAQINLRGKGDGIALAHCAIVRGDGHRALQYYANGAWNAFGVLGHPIPSRSLDEIIEQVGDVRFLKIDCEGAEWPILYTCKNIERIRQIAGEYHIIDASPDELKNLPHQIGIVGLVQFLYSHGFSVQFEAHGPTIGNFWAQRL